MFRGDIIKKLIKGVFILALFSVITRIIGFVYKIWLSHLITNESLGLYSIVISIFMVFITLVSSGMPISVCKITASNKVNKNYQNSHATVYGGLLIGLALSGVLIIILFTFKMFFTQLLGSNECYFLLLSLIPAIVSGAIYSPFKGYLWGEEKYFKVSIVEFFEQIIKIAVLFILVLIGFNMNTLFPLGFAISLSAILSTLIGIIYYFTSGGKLSKKFIPYKPIIKSALPLTTTRFANSLMQPLIAIILPFRLVSLGFTKSQALSMLGVAMGMTFPILTIPTTLIGSLSMALIPEIASLLKKQNKEALKKQISTSILFTLCCSFLCVPIFFALAHPLCTLLFSNADAGIYLRYATWTIIPTGLSLISTSILNSINCEKYTFRFFIFSSLISLLLILILPTYLGVNSLFFAIGTSLILIFILNTYKINKELKIRQSNIKPIILHLIITIPVTFLTGWCFNIFQLLYGTILSLIISSIISVVSFIMLLMVFNLLDIKIIFNSLQKNHNPAIAKTKKLKVSKSIAK